MIGGPIFGLLWIALIVVGVWLLLRALRERDGGGFGPPFLGGRRSGRARDILDERYARGEISSEEYRERVEHLESEYPPR